MVLSRIAECKRKQQRRHKPRVNALDTTLTMAITELLYKTAAVLNAISIPGHTAMGFKTVHPTLDSIDTTASQDRKVGQTGAATAWDFFNASLLVSGKPLCD